VTLLTVRIVVKNSPEIFHVKPEKVTNFKVCVKKLLTRYLRKWLYRKETSEQYKKIKM
jgi:hypothetical protein